MDKPFDPFVQCDKYLTELKSLRQQVAEKTELIEQLTETINKALHWTGVDGMSLFSRYSIVVDTLRDGQAKQKEKA